MDCLPWLLFPPLEVLIVSFLWTGRDAGSCGPRGLSSEVIHSMGNHPVDIHPGLIDHVMEVPDQSLICVSDNIVSRLIYEIVGYAHNRLDTGFKAVNVALQLFVLGPKFEEMNRLRVDWIHGIRVVVVSGKRGVRVSRWVFVGD